MTKFISVKVFRGTIPEGEKYGKFGGMPGACFRVAAEDDDHVKCFHVSEPPFNPEHLENQDKIKASVFASLMLNPYPDLDVELVGAEVFAEYKITPAENGDSKIERIK
ncbi:TPA: hypothetical protein KWI50_000484 [Escherichia coli]|nr:hypothetical protein [Escherichia coli]HBH7222304.1 hypothetical protein [Escherichia coli]HBH7711533.1 hypothetical protein [Escherichia coli]HBK3129023.1 hypothetical protein [Escherichia coli]